MQQLETILATMRVAVTIHHNGQYCGQWSVDTSGSHFINFHIVSHGRCYLKASPDSENVEILNTGDMVIFPTDSQHCLSGDSLFSADVNTAQPIGFENGALPDATGLLCGYFSHHHPVMNSIMAQLPEVIVLRQSEQEPTTLRTLLQALVLEAKSSGLSDNWLLNKIADAVMALLFTQYLSGSEGILAGMAHPKLRNAVDMILQSPQNKWTVEELAQACFMSRTAFANAFSKTLGMTPMEFVTHWRLSMAYHQLAMGEHSTLQIALNAGYDNESSFSKAFKRVLGMTPGAVRADKSALSG